MERRICLIYSPKYIDSLIKFHVILLQFTIFILTYHLLRQNTCNKFIICKAVSMKRLWNWHRICIAVHRRTLTGSATPTVSFKSVQGVLFPGVKRPWHEPLLLSTAGFKIFFLLWLCDPTRVMASSFLRFLDHTQRRTTAGGTLLDEWSARRRDLYLTTHNSHNRQTSIPLVGFEPTISAHERPQTYALDRAATGTGRG